MPTIRNRLHPYHDYSEHDQVSLYSLDGTGLAGQLVKIVTGTANPQSTQTDAFGSSPVGVNYNGAQSFRYETLWKVTPTASGDTRFNALGITKLSTLEYDENGMPLKYMPERAKQIGAVVSGETVPIINKATILGVWGNYIDTSLGAPQPGHLVVISRSGNGTLGAIAPTSTLFSASGVPTLTSIYTPNSVVGKWLSSLPTSTNTGVANEFSAQGGYAFFEFSPQA
jgi:hypothetical protein